MSITQVYEVRGAREGGYDSQWRRTYKRVWRVETDSSLTGALAVRTAIPVTLGNYYAVYNGNTLLEYDLFSFVVNIKCQIDPGCNDDCSWLVAVEYGPYDPSTFPENPLNHPLKISSGSNRFERAVEQDINGNGVLNSAGDYFDPPVVIDDSRPTLKIVRNEQTFSPQYADTFKDTLNKFVFFDYAPLTVKCLPITGELEYNPVCGFYYVVTYEFEIDPNGWKKLILDQGLRLIDGTKQKPAVDVNGQPVTSPVLLDGMGGQLATGATPVFLEFDVYPVSDFTLLNLDPAGQPGQ